MSRPPRILISAGEASGDRLGAGLARALVRRRPGVDLLGMGGERMAEAGVRRVQDAAEVSVVGIFEVVRHLPALRRAMTRLEEALRRDRPDVLVAVDFPDFNLRLARRARRAGVPVVYFVSPQIWAWRRGRVRSMRALVRRMLVLFPFEAAFYEDAGVPVTFVGHPAVDAVPAAADRAALLARAGLDPGLPTVALLPGSRRGEVERLLPVLIEAAQRVEAAHPDVQFLLVRAGGLVPETLERPLSAAGLRRAVVHANDYPDVLAACDVGVVSSGTASLEAALAGLPMVVVYRVHPLSWVLARLLVRVEHAALPNLVAGREVVPELLQGRCTPEAIASRLLDYLASPSARERVRRDLRGVRDRLGAPGAFDRAADAVLSELDGAGTGASGPDS